jgi:hypothetical protein
MVGGTDRLGVQHDRGRILGPARLLSGLATQQIMHAWSIPSSRHNTK